MSSREPIPAWSANPALAAKSISRVGLMIALIGALSVLMPVALLAELPDVGRSRAWVWTVGVLIWSGFRLSLLISAGAPRLFDFFFHLYCYIFMGIGPTAQIRTDSLSTTTQGIDPALDVPTAQVVVGGILCYEIGRGVLVFLERRRAEAQARRPEVLGEQPFGRALALVSPLRSLALGAVGFAAAAYYVAKIGVGSLFVSRATSREMITLAWSDPATQAIVRALAIFPLLVCVGAVNELRRSSRGSSRFLYVMVMLVAMVALLSVVNPISSARYTFGTVLFAFVIFAGPLRTRLSATITMASTLAGFLLLFPLADAFRRDEANFAGRGGFFAEYVGNADYDSFWQIANALLFWLDGLVEPLNQFFGSIFFWVPRAIWADKPIDTGILLAQYRGYSFSNLSAPAWAEMLVNGGPVAVVIGFLILGVVLRKLDSLIVPAFRTGGWLTLVGAIFPVYLMILLRGSLLQATGSLVVAIACVIFVRARPGSSNPTRPVGFARPTRRSESAGAGESRR